MNKNIELPALDITEEDRDLSKALKLPDDLMPDDLMNTGAWIAKMTAWMGAARVCRERQLLAAHARIEELTSALERLRANAQRIFDKVPVKDWDETLAEADAALKERT